MPRKIFLAIVIFPLLLVSCRDERTQAQRSLQAKGIPLHAEQINAAVERGDEITLDQLLVCGVFANQSDDAGKTPLLRACERSDFRMVRQLLQKGTGVHSSDAKIQRGSPLATAALHGDIAIAKALLQHGANPQQKMAEGQPLLLWCIQNGRYIIADALLSHGADLHTTDRFGNNALAYALQYGRRSLADRMLALGADAGRPTNKEGAFTPPLIRCLQLEWLDLLPTLVKRGADLYATDHQGSTALDYASISHDPARLLLVLNLHPDPNVTLADGRSLFLWSLSYEENFSLGLLEKGANPNTADAEAVSLLSHSIRQGKRKLCEALLARGASAKESATASNDKSPILLRAMEQGWMELIEPLVKNGADINAVNAQGQNAAIAALEQGKVEAFQRLVRLGAQPPQATWSTTLHEAVATAKLPKLRSLLAAGIRPDPATDDSLQLLQTALRQKDLSPLTILLEHQIQHDALFHQACEMGRLDILQLLEKNGFTHDPLLDATYDHPLHAAVRSGNAELLHHLLQSPYNIHVLGIENQTPLVCAIARHRHEMVRLLLKYKADPNRLLESKANPAFLSLFANKGMRWYLSFDRNLTPLMIAADSGQVEMARTLMENGAKLGTYTAVNKTWPLNFACRNADVPMMRLLLRKNPYVETQKIVVSLKKQEAQLFDTCGNVIFSTKVSTGKRGFATPTGTYVITNKHRDWSSTIYQGASMPCFQRLSCGDFGFHQGIVPGYPASHGCLRVPYGNAQKLFALTQVGDRVEIE